MNQAAMLAQVARTFADRPAISSGTKVMRTYRAFADRVARLATGLSARGLQRGDRVAIVMKNVPGITRSCTVLARRAGGGSVNAKLRKGIAFILQNCGARAVSYARYRHCSAIPRRRSHRRGMDCRSGYRGIRCAV